MRIVLLARDTPLAETLLARPPRVLSALALLAGGLLAAAGALAFFARVDLGVTAPVRVRPSDSPPDDLDAVSGQRISAAVGGRVAEICCRGGDEVRRGDVLVRLDLTRLDAGIARVEVQEKALFEQALHAETILPALDRQGQARLGEVP